MFKTYLLGIICLIIAAECLRRARGVPSYPHHRIPQHNLTGKWSSLEQYRRERAQVFAKEREAQRARWDIAAANSQEAVRLGTFEQSRQVRS